MRYGSATPNEFASALAFHHLYLRLSCGRSFEGITGYGEEERSQEEWR